MASRRIYAATVSAVLWCTAITTVAMAGDRAGDGSDKAWRSLTPTAELQHKLPHVEQLTKALRQAGLGSYSSTQHLARYQLVDARDYAAALRWMRSPDQPLFIAAGEPLLWQQAWQRATPQTQLTAADESRVGIYRRVHETPQGVLVQRIGWSSQPLADSLSGHSQLLSSRAELRQGDRLLSAELLINEWDGITAPILATASTRLPALLAADSARRYLQPGDVVALAGGRQHGVQPAQAFAYPHGQVLVFRVYEQLSMGVVTQLANATPWSINQVLPYGR